MISRRQSYAALEKTELYVSPYSRKIKQVNGAYGFFNGLIHRKHKGAGEKPDAISIFYKQDFLQRIPELAFESTAGILEAPRQTLGQHEFLNLICQRLYIEFYGIPVTEESFQACRVVFDWLFDAGQMDFHQLSGQRRSEIAASLAVLREVIAQSVAGAEIPQDPVSATVVARSLALQREFALTDDDVIDLLLGVLVGTCPVLEAGFEKLVHALTTRRTFQSKIYQAASVGDEQSIEMFLQEIGGAFVAEHIARVAGETHTVETAFRSTLQIEKNEIVHFWLDPAKIKRDELPPSIAFNIENPAENYLRYGAEPHISFGKAIAVKVFSTVLANIFSAYRIRDYDHKELRLERLPLDPNAYQFRILGSSPPWAVGEEQAWLLDAYGFKQHSQHNILSFKEFFHLLILQSVTFFRSNIFYACYDKRHHVVMGSSFAGAGQATLAMGDMMHRFFANTQRGVLKPATHFSETGQFEAVFDAYSTIRKNYFTWAYYTAFLDGGREFLFEALLIFRPKEGFKPLTVVGNVLLFVVISLVAVLLKTPFVKTRLRNYFESTVAANLEAMRPAIASLDEILADGRPYIFGEEFTAADIHLCANMGNLIIPDEFQGGGKLPPLDHYPPTYRKNVEEFRQTLTGQYVQRVYGQHRVYTRSV